MNNGSSWGIASGGGVLFSNSKINFRDMADGSTNTIMVGEVSSALTDTSGNQQEWIPSQPWGWAIGQKSVNSPPNFTVVSDCRIFNMTTVRYPINRKTGWNGDKNSTGVGNDGAANIPLTSSHSAGGVNVLMGDGSVRFVGANISTNTLGCLATRDDGQVFGEF